MLPRARLESQYYDEGGLKGVSSSTCYCKMPSVDLVTSCSSAGGVDVRMSGMATPSGSAGVTIPMVSATRP